MGNDALAAESASRPKNRAVFLDRDGVLNAAVVRDGKPYPPQTPESFQLLDGVAEACRRLNAAGFLLVVATNQPDVGRGTQKRETVEAMHALLRAEVPLDRIECCFHAGGAELCACRKPAPGMLLQAAAVLEIDLSRSYMVGDRWRDIDCGAAAGCRTIFIDRGYSELLRTKPDLFAHGLPDATEAILAEGWHA